ncbi:MAG: hypothetical protein FJ128_11670 [Deltaproteobacteria bacterium]|nr:hypothetical protein [Deltaproteobacteria bacterium]
MRFKSLKDLERDAPREIVLATLPQVVRLTDFAKAKAFAVSRLVRRVHGQAFEWYGFTLAQRSRPEIIVDVGLPTHAENQETYVSLSAEGIAAYQEALPPDRLINGWIHSHGKLEFRDFSGIDAANQATVLDYVTSLLKIPVAKKEVVIRDLALGLLGEGEAEALAAGSVTLLTDAPVRRARLLETVYGGFCYAFVIGDAGWTRQEIHYKTRGVLTGETHLSKREADLEIIPTGRILTPSDLETLETEVKERLRPVAYIPEKLERG